MTYLPTFLPQNPLLNGDPEGWASCTAYSAAMSGDFDTHGAKRPTGRDEMRWTANIPKNSDGLRQYQSTGWQVCVRSCSPSYRSGPWIEARGWYTNHGYQNARLTSPLSTVASGGTITIKLAPGSGGLTTHFAGVYIDPAFHGGSSGTVVREWSGAFSGTVTLPVLPSGAHRLVLVASDGLDAGVLSIGFVVP